MGREESPFEEIRERAHSTMRAVEDSQVSVDVDHAKHLTCASSPPLSRRTVAKMSSLSRPLSDPSSVDACGGPRGDGLSICVCVSVEVDFVEWTILSLENVRGGGVGGGHTSPAP